MYIVSVTCPGGCTRRVHQSSSSGGDDTWITAFWPTPSAETTTEKKIKKKPTCLSHWFRILTRTQFIRTVGCACSSPLNKTDQPLPPEDKRYKNTETRDLRLKKEKGKKQLSAILFYGGEVDMSAQWDPASNKDQHYFHCCCFFILMTMSMF